MIITAAGAPLSSEVCVELSIVLMHASRHCRTRVVVSTSRYHQTSPGTRELVDTLHRLDAKCSVCAAEMFPTPSFWVSMLHVTAICPRYRATHAQHHHTWLEAGPMAQIGQTHAQQATRHARRIYVGGLPPTASDQTVATFVSHALAAIGGNTAGPGVCLATLTTNPEGVLFFWGLQHDADAVMLSACWSERWYEGPCMGAFHVLHCTSRLSGTGCAWDSSEPHCTVANRRREQEFVWKGWGCEADRLLAVPCRQCCGQRIHQ